MGLIAGLDFGTSSVKLAVADRAGFIVAQAQAEYPTTVGTHGEREQHPDHWWRAAAKVIDEVGVGADIIALGITGQMQDLIPVAGDRAVRPALLYSDTRAVAQHSRLADALTQWEAATGNIQDPTNVAAKIAWLHDHEPDSLARADHLLFGAGGYIAWRATGIATCDVLTASTTGLLDVQRRTWSPDILTAAGATAGQMPVLVGMTPGDDRVGELTPRAAQEIGLRAGIPVVVATGDAGAATDGLVGSEPGDAYIYLGTTGWLAAVTPAVDTGAVASPIHSLVMPGWRDRLRIGAVQSAGSAADWSRRTFFEGADFSVVEAALADRVTDATAFDARPLCLPGLAGERTPVRDETFRGAFVGVSEATTVADMHLAVLTGVALALRHVADELGVSQRRIPVVGGASASVAWRQILADVFDATIVTRETRDPGTFSAMRAAATTVRAAESFPPLFTPTPDDTETTPSGICARYPPVITAHRELYNALAPTFHRIES
ncbi:FGGY family carbohydrate kinase [Microbacterium aquimaris]|uniref:xylulokinase n=1 Tax=Microbacterium aquimaris TaxID=459816 RepID=UPI002AD4746A|nr:FGGY family carbohydrate kinase [Microbacterium aquimaris]MDZ8274802.1 FGGY family carbohydrate kinase [Microbacterium aquimaris]